MKIMPIVGCAIIIILVILVAFAGIKLKNKMDWEKEQSYCYDDSLVLYSNSNIIIIEIEKYSCKEIDYAISNNLNLAWTKNPMVRIKYLKCHKVYGNGDFINQTEISRSNFTDYESYPKSELGEYYLNNCINNAFSEDSE